MEKKMKKKRALSMLLSFVFLASVACSVPTQSGGGKDWENPSSDLYAATVNSIVATDALGRSFGESSSAVSA